MSVTAALHNAANAVSSMPGIAQANSAFNAQQARLQREWTEEQSAKAMAFNANEAAKNRNWQQMMSNTAHQREIADLKAAGLNPVLSAMNGNGASVGSGATASAVVGSGSKADADTSASGAIANLLGSILSAQTSLENANINARTQEAIADKYTAMSEIVANINASASKYAADTHAWASRYSSDTSAAASKYAADIHAGASKYASDKSSDATIKSAGIHAGASKYASEQSAAASRYATDHTKYGMIDNLVRGISDAVFGNSGVSSAKRVSSGVMSAVQHVSDSLKHNPGYVSWNDSLLGKAFNNLRKKK